MSYLLDTNAAIAIANGAVTVRRRARYHSVADIALSSIVMHELYFGAYNGNQTNDTLSIIQELPFSVIDFDSEDAMRAAEIRAALQSRGTPIGPYDVLIAGQALSRDLTVVTRNIREFSRVEGLRVENWEA